MATNSVLDSMTKTYSLPGNAAYKYPTLVRHKGTVIAFAMDNQRKIYYSVLSPDSSTWSEAPTELIFPTEINRVGFDIIPLTRLSVFKKGSDTPELAGKPLPAYSDSDSRTYDYFRSTTARLTADFPFQVLSDGQYVYVFRQAAAPDDKDPDKTAIQDMKDTLLVDRFMLVGTAAPAASAGGASSATARLEGKLEVRYQRSRNKSHPLNSKDTLGAKDLDNNLFYEPTQQLGFIGQVKDGHFTVLVLPTQVANVSRWQIFTHSATTGMLNSFNIERSADGLFNTRGSQSYRDMTYSSAGGMLTLDSNSYVKLASGAALTDGAFTLEAWINPTSGVSGAQALFTSKGDQTDNLGASRRDPKTGPSVWVMGKKLCVGFGDNTNWFEYTSADLLNLDQWNHIAVVSDGKTYSICIDGQAPVQVDKWDAYTPGGGKTSVSGLPSGATPSGTLPSFIGGTSNYFKGNIEEVRLWTRARGFGELQADLNRQLTGREPGLVGYWRLDEGSGSTIYDLTDNMVKGTIMNGASKSTSPVWGPSTAPLGETAGISRDIFLFTDRKVASGLSALLYYRQTPSPSGGTGEPKPLKQDARVMLAAATSDANGGGTPYIAVLDWGVSNTGKLPEIPVVRELGTPINAPNVTGQKLNDAIDAITQQQSLVDSLTAQITTLNSQIAELKAMIAPLQPAKDRLDFLRQKVKEGGGLSAVYRAELDLLEHLFQDPPFNQVDNYVNDRDAKTRQRDLLQTQLQAAQDSVAAAQAVLKGGVSAQMALITVDPRGLTVTGGLLGFAWSADTPRLFDSANGSVALYFHGGNDQFFVAYYQTLNQIAQASLTDQGSNAVVTLAARSSDLLNSIKVTVAGQAGDPCTVTITGGGVSEPFSNVPRDPLGFQQRINGQGGSCLVAAVLPSDLDANLPVPTAKVTNTNQPVTLTGALPCAWTAAFPGAALSFNGNGSYATAAATGTANTNLMGDLTLEAWARPTQTAPSAGETTHYLVKHRSNDSDYTLGVQRKLRTSAMEFKGDACVVIPDQVQLNFEGAITIEAWVKPAAITDGQHSIVTRAFSETLAGRFEVFLRISQTNGVSTYEVGSLTASVTHATTWPIPADQLQAWTHLAGVYDGKNWTLYCNGQQPVTTVQPLPPLGGNANWAIGGRGTPSTDTDKRYFTGAIDDVRIWKKARTQADIQANMYRRLSGNETDLVGYWYVEGGVAKDHTRYGADGTWSDGKAHATTASPLYTHNLFAAVNGKYVEAPSPDDFPSGQWNHLAAALQIPHSLRFDGQDNYLDAGASETYDLSGDLTIEAFVQVDDLSAARSIVTRGQFKGGAHRSPYALAVNSDGTLVFSFQDTNGKVHAFTSSNTSSNKLDTTKPHRVAVTRKARTKSALVDIMGEGNQATTVVDHKYVTFGWSDITLYIDDTNSGELMWYLPDAAASVASTTLSNALGPAATDTGFQALINALPKSNVFSPPAIGSTDEAVEIGRGYEATLPFKGVVSQVRLWNTALPADQLLQRDPGKATGLVAWWAFAEGKLDKVANSAGADTADIKGKPNWVTIPDKSAWSLELYHNGKRLPVCESASALPVGDSQFTLGACLVNGTAQGLFQGEMDEVRVWNVARTPEQIQDNVFRRLQGDYEDLVAYYAVADNSSDLHGPATLADQSPLENNLSITNVSHNYSSAPLGQDTPQVRSALAGVRTPFSGMIQSQPDVAEYAEMQYDSHRNLVGVFKRCYTYILNGNWELISGFKVGDMYTEWVGQAQFAPQLYGFIEGAPPVPGENLTIRDPLFGSPTDYTDAARVMFVQADRTTTTYAASRDTGFDMSIDALIGGGVSEEAEAGQFVYAKVTEVEDLIAARFQADYTSSYLEDVTMAVGKETTRKASMALRGNWENPGVTATSTNVGRRFVPDNMGMALVQSQTADVFALRLRSNHALIAYQMRPNVDIPPDWNIITFPINPQYTKQGTLDGKLGTQADADYPAAMQYSSDSSYFKPIEAYSLKRQVENEEATLQAYFEQYEAGRIGRGEAQDPSGRLLTDGSYDPILRSSFSTDLATKQTNLQYLRDGLKGLAKRNLVNTYVWTADGGLFAETEQTMDAFEEQYGGAYSFKGMGGLKIGVKEVIGGGMIAAELNAMFGRHIDVTVTKNKSSETSFELEVDLDKVEPDIYERVFNADGSSTFKLDENNQPVKKPGKVDAYRFMTFFLAPDHTYHDEFFNKVVDPQWLQGDTPGAVALSQAQDDTRRPACWRIMHRVTYVSRVLAPLADEAPAALEKSMQALEIDSNYELIKLFEPYVSGKRGSYKELSDAIDQALTIAKYKALQPYAYDIKQFMSLYYDVPQQAMYLPTPAATTRASDGTIQGTAMPKIDVHPDAGASDIIARLPAAQEAVVVGRNLDKSWLQIRLPDNGDVGWVNASDVNVTPNDVTPLPVVIKATTASAKQTTVSMYEKPNATSKVVGTLNRGDSVTISGRTDDRTWLNVKNGTVTGWVNAAFVDTPGDISKLDVVNS